MKKVLFYTLITTLLLSGCSSVSSSAPNPNETYRVSRSSTPATLELRTIPKHIVIVIEENRSYAEITGNPNAPYINELMRGGASFTNYHGVEHPSQPNYLDIFSGFNQGITTDNYVGRSLDAPNLYTALNGIGKTFLGYSESLPIPGYTGQATGEYAPKHSPWVSFANVPQNTVNLPFTSFPTDYTQLPDVSVVIPNLMDDMHDGTIAQGDSWLKKNISPYVQWSKTHDSLLIVTWDEDDNADRNTVPTFFVGPMVRPGTYDEEANHFSLLRTIETLYGLPFLGHSQNVQPITEIWR